MKISVLLGGTSPERHVSMASGIAVAKALSESGHNVSLYDVALGKEALVTLDKLHLPSELHPSESELAELSNASIVEAIQLLKPATEVAFLALHGSPGEDGTVQALLDLLGVPYTGSGIMASSIAIDKAMTKRILESADVQTPSWFQLPSSTTTRESVLGLVDTHTGYPVVIKPNDGGSTVGMTIANGPDEVFAGYELASRFSRTVLFEEYIPGRELTVAVLGHDSLPIVEIAPKSGFYDYKSKYTAGQTDYLCPAPLSRALEEEIRELARRSHVAVGCTGYSRVDFRLNPDDVPYCLEINTLPGMTATSLVPKAAAAAGITFPKLCETIVQLALNPLAADDVD